MQKQNNPELETELTERNQFLVFVLGQELFAMDIRAVKEITEVCRLTSVPRMPEFIRGVINLRGAVVPVVDLAARFGKPPMELGRRTCIIIIEFGASDREKQDVGVLVDGVSSVTEIPRAEINPPPSFGESIRTDFISGVGKINEEFVIILNVDYVLNLDERDALVGVASGVGEKVADGALAA